MKLRPLAIEGAFEITPELRADARGSFMEWYRQDAFAEAVGHRLDLVQSNISVSARNVIRGIHFAEVPPGQAKYVSCARGAGVDVIVDIRVGSPTFGRWEMTLLDDVSWRSVYLAEGLGHAFCALTDDATLLYLCSAGYNPAREHTIDPLDPDLAIDWPVKEPILSERDASAPSFASAAQSGLLPSYAACTEYTRMLGSLTSDLGR